MVVLLRLLRNKLQATERYIKCSGYSVVRVVKRGSNHDIAKRSICGQFDSKT